MKHENNKNYYFIDPRYPQENQVFPTRSTISVNLKPNLNSRTGTEKVPCLKDCEVESITYDYKESRYTKTTQPIGIYVKPNHHNQLQD